METIARLSIKSKIALLKVYSVNTKSTVSIVIIDFVKGITRFLIDKTFLNLCQSIFVFLAVYCNQIFKHWLESSFSIKL